MKYKDNPSADEIANMTLDEIANMTLDEISQIMMEHTPDRLKLSLAALTKIKDGEMPVAKCKEDQEFVTILGDTIKGQIQLVKQLRTLLNDRGFSNTELGRYLASKGNEYDPKQEFNVPLNQFKDDEAGDCAKLLCNHVKAAGIDPDSEESLKTVKSPFGMALSDTAFGLYHLLRCLGIPHEAIQDGISKMERIAKEKEQANGTTATA